MGFNNIKEFQQKLNAFAITEIPQTFKRRQIEIVVFMWKTIRNHTPVADDNSEWPGFKGGFAKTNWRVTLNSIPSGTLGKRGKPITLISEEHVRAKLSTMNQGLGSRQGKADIIWVFNNVKYIQYLAEGHSPKALPGEMIDLSLEMTRDFIASKGWF